MNKVQAIEFVESGKGFLARGLYMGYKASNKRRAAPKQGQSALWVESFHTVMVGAIPVIVKDRVADGVKAEDCVSPFKNLQPVYVEMTGDCESLDYGKALSCTGRVHNIVENGIAQPKELK